jgi:predicted secreted protein
VILGIEFSPSCAVYNLYGPPPNRVKSGSGIFIEELKKILSKEKIKIPIIGVSIYSIENTINELNSIIKG